jgi:RimJ/RimL family protein N-acetyltransferase
MRLTISTPRLLLRLPEASDAAAIARCVDDLGVARMAASIPHPYSVEIAAGWIEFARIRARRGQAYSFVIEQWTRDGLSLGVVGGAGVFRRTEGADWEVGYHVGRAHQGQGIATEAVLRLVDWARAELDPPRLIAGCFEDNPASARVLQKAGFRPTGTRHLSYSLGRNAKAVCIDLALELMATEAAA